MTKTPKKLLALLGAAGLATIGAALAAASPGGHGGPGGPGDPGREHHRHPGKWWQSPEIVKELALDARQQDELDRLHRESRERSIDLRAALEKKELALEDAVEGDPFDEGRARAAASEVATGRSELGKQELELRIAVRKVLSGEQFAKLRSLLPPPPPPPPPGPPRPPMPPMAAPGLPPDAPEPPAPSMPPDAPLPPA